MNLKEKLSQEIDIFTKKHHLTVTQKDFLYAGPHRRTRHALILAFTDVGLFTFHFNLGEGSMHYLAKEFFQQIEIMKKKGVYFLKITTLKEGKREEAHYLVSKRVLGRRWHAQTLKKLIAREGSSFSPMK